MNLKSHYKIIISIIIIIILVSSLIIYFYPHNNTYYYNNGKNIEIKYFNNMDRINNYFYNTFNNYSLSSDSIDNNKISYLNSTLINPFYYPCNGFTSYLKINLKNINNNYVYITISDYNHNNLYPHLVGINNTHTLNNNQTVFKINKNNNLNNICVYIPCFNNYLNDNYYNFTIKISSGKLYNIFYINTLKESAIYGTVGLSNKSQTQDYTMNSTMFVYNDNTGRYNIVNITNGEYYFFTVPRDSYNLYYISNNTLKCFYMNSNKGIVKAGSISSPPYMESLLEDIFMWFIINLKSHYKIIIYIIFIL